MSHLTNNVSYNEIKNITDWMLSDESQRSAFVRLVKAISSLDIPFDSYKPRSPQAKLGQITTKSSAG